MNGRPSFTSYSWESRPQLLYLRWCWLQGEQSPPPSRGRHCISPPRIWALLRSVRFRWALIFSILQTVVLAGRCCGSQTSWKLGRADRRARTYSTLVPDVPDTVFVRICSLFDNEMDATPFHTELDSCPASLVTGHDESPTIQAFGPVVQITNVGSHPHGIPLYINLTQASPTDPWQRRERRCVSSFVST